MNLTWWIGRAMSCNFVLVTLLRLYLLMFACQFVLSSNLEYDFAVDHSALLMQPNLQTETVCVGTNQSFDLLGMGFIGDKLMMMNTDLAFLEMPKSALDTASDEWALYDATRDTVENRWKTEYEMMNPYLQSNMTIKTAFTGENEQKKIIFACESKTASKSYYYLDVESISTGQSPLPESLEQVSATYISVEKNYSFVFSKTDNSTTLVVFNLDFKLVLALQDNFSMSLCKGAKENEIRIDPLGSSNVVHGCLPLTDWDIRTTSLYIDGRFYLFGSDEVYMFSFDPIGHRNVSNTVTFKKKSFKDLFECFRPPPTTATSLGPTSNTSGPVSKPGNVTEAHHPNGNATGHEWASETTAKSSLVLIIIIVLVVIVALVALALIYCLFCGKKKKDEKKADEKSKKKKPASDKDKKSSAKDKKGDKTKQTTAKKAVADKSSKAPEKSSPSKAKDQKASSTKAKSNIIKSSVSAKGAKPKETIVQDNKNAHNQLGSSMNSSTFSKQSNTGNSSFAMSNAYSAGGSSVISKAGASNAQSSSVGGSNVYSKAVAAGAGGASSVLSKAGGSSVSKAGTSVRSTVPQKMTKKSVSKNKNNPAPNSKNK